MSYPIEEKLLPVGTNRPGTPITVKGVISHRTANKNADARDHYAYFAGGNRSASCHYFVDSERILRIIPEAEMAWHAGNVTAADWTLGNPNGWTIGIELCENHAYSSAEGVQAWERYVWLHADICRRYGLNPAADIYGHFEVDPVNRGSDPVGLFAWEPFIREVSNRVKAPQKGTPILGVPECTLDQATAFLRKKAPGWEDLAAVYWMVGSDYGVRGDVALAQACKETGYFRFGGAVTPDMNNFCGLKTRDADGDEPSDHMTFPNKRTGVEAHVQHLALYADAPKLAGKEIVDPRHFESIRGKAKTVEALGENWAPAESYGKSIVEDYLRPLLAYEMPVVEPPQEDTVTIPRTEYNAYREWKENRDRLQLKIEAILGAAGEAAQVMREIPR